MIRPLTEPAAPAPPVNTPARWAMLAFSTLLFYSFFTRLRLWIALKQKALPLFSFQTHGVWALFGGLWHDLVLAVWCGCGVWLLASWLRQLSNSRPWSPVWTTLNQIAVHLALLVVALITAGHHKVLFEMQSGLTYDLLREANTALSPRAFWTFLSFADAFFLLLPVGIMWALYKAPERLRPWWERMAGLLTAGVILLELALALGAASPLHPAIAMTPVRFLAHDFVRHYTPSLDDDMEPVAPVKPLARRPSVPPPPFPAKRPKKKPLTQYASPFPKPSSQDQSMRLLAPLFARPGLPARDLLPPKTDDMPKRWNVVVLVLESLGTRYMFDTSHGNRTPMPFLQKISKQSWYFDNHFSTANSSPRSLFSIFTGLYPIPQFNMFVMRKDVKTPTLAGYMPKEYEQFLVTPAGLFWYFPKHFFLNNGPKELIGARSKPLRRIKKKGSFPSEIGVTSYFIKRITEAKEPFHATYVSFIPHGPYVDYGPKYRLLPNVKKNFHRYINNLNVLDLQIARIFKALEASGRMKRTIVVMVGDHGQAFWQHRYNYGHSRMSYSENYHAPLFFYQPRLFKPKIWHRLTSHVDILPTLLDALRLPYNPYLLQGESLFQSRFARKQIFLFGNEQTLSSMQPEGPKLQYSLRRRRCWVYDLKTDPKEKKRLRCKEYQEQRQALRRFLKLQKGLIFGYNRTREKGEPFFGQTHKPPQKQATPTP